MPPLLESVHIVQKLVAKQTTNAGFFCDIRFSLFGELHDSMPDYGRKIPPKSLWTGVVLPLIFGANRLGLKHKLVHERVRKKKLQRLSGGNFLVPILRSRNGSELSKRSNWVWLLSEAARFGLERKFRRWFFLLSAKNNEFIS